MVKRIDSRSPSLFLFTFCFPTTPINGIQLLSLINSRYSFNDDDDDGGGGGDGIAKHMNHL